MQWINNVLDSAFQPHDTSYESSAEETGGEDEELNSLGEGDTEEHLQRDQEDGGDDDLVENDGSKVNDKIMDFEEDAFINNSSNSKYNNSTYESSITSGDYQSLGTKQNFSDVNIESTESPNMRTGETSEALLSREEPGPSLPISRLSPSGIDNSRTQSTVGESKSQIQQNVQLETVKRVKICVREDTKQTKSDNKLHLSEEEEVFEDICITPRLPPDVTQKIGVNTSAGSRENPTTNDNSNVLRIDGKRNLTGDSFNSDADSFSIDSSPSQVVAPSLPSSVSETRLFEDFRVQNFLSSWKDDGSLSTFDPETMNCYGVVHVRILRSQRLPCSVGSNVQAIVSLKPWKGRVRTERVRTFRLDNHSSSFDNGVVAQWLKQNEEDPASELSMVHVYSGEETPIPSIHVELMLCTLKMFEFSMCSLTLPCHVLMRNPGTWIRQWFVAAAAHDNESRDIGDEVPLIELEAMFTPAEEKRIESAAFIDDNQTSTAYFEDNDFTENSFDMNDSDVLLNLPVFAAERRRSLVSTDTEDNNTVVTTTSTKQGTVKTVSSKQHLLRLKTFWTPAVCCVCSSVIMAGWKQGFYCEVCKIDCCSDCRLSADVQTPCGSEKAQIARTKAIQNKLTIDNVLETVAPVDEKKKIEIEEKASLEAISSNNKKSSIGSVDGRIMEEDIGIGTLELNFLEACIFSSSFPAETDPADVVRPKEHTIMRPGDYYLRVHWTGSVSTARTQTVQNSLGKLKFGATEMRLNVPHYGVEFRIDVVDAATDTIVGSTVLATQTLLQQQRDAMVDEEGFRVFELAKGPPKFQGTRPMLLELRSGFKSGFFASSGKGVEGQIVGWIEVRAGLIENVEQLFGREPIKCPARPPYDLNLIVLQTHINRISTIIKETKRTIQAFQFLVSWRNPALSGGSLFVFVWFCLDFNAEYFGCLPFLFLLLYMLMHASLRQTGASKNYFLRKEADDFREAEKKIDVHYKLHRPLGTVNISVLRGKNIRSRDLGLPGNVCCWLYWDPLRYLKEKYRKSYLEIDRSAGTKHSIGFTDSTYTVNPVWNKIEESDESKCLKHLIPNNSTYFDSSSFVNEDSPSSAVFQFPVLQPLKSSGFSSSTEYPINASLEPWTASPAAIVVQVMFRDILNMLPGSDHIFGEISIPFAHLVRSGEILGWYRILEVGTTRVAPFSGVQKRTPSKEIDNENGNPTNLEQTEDVDDAPRVFLHIKWIPPAEHSGARVADTEREASIVVQEELIRRSVFGRENKANVVDSSIGALNTIRGLSGILQVVQNALGSALDFFESFRNAFNFTDPYKSTVLLILVSLGFLIFSLIPTRFVVLLGGLAIYVKNFISRFGNKSSAMICQSSGHILDDPDIPTPGSEDKAVSSGALGTWIVNAFLGLPTDEDLRKTYFWESRRLGVVEREMYGTKKRLARLQRLWKAQWHASVKVRCDGIHNTNKNAPSCKWKNAFAVLQGRQFLWWSSADDFDNGEAPLGKIFFSGHSGLSNPSPLEMRELKAEEIPLITIIFGRGMKKTKDLQLQQQERLTLLTTDVETKDSLESAVLLALSTKED